MNYKITNKIDELKGKYKEYRKHGIFCETLAFALSLGIPVTALAIRYYFYSAGADAVSLGICGFAPGIVCGLVSGEAANESFDKAKETKKQISELEKKLN